MKHLFKIIFAYLFLFSFQFLYAQEWKTTEKGVKYRTIKANPKNRKAKIGEIINFNIAIYNGKDSVLMKSTSSQINWQGKETERDLRTTPIEVLTSANEKDSLEVWVSLDTLRKYEGQLNPIVDVGNHLKYYLKINSIRSNQELQAEKEQKEKVQKTKEIKEIQAYLKKNKLIAKAYPSGLHIVTLSKGSGAKPQKEQTVVAHYTGKLLSGTKFDSSLDRNRPFEFKIGMGQVIKGWDEGFAELQAGTKAILLIPSAMGYGERGAGRDIPPNSVLVFEVELLEVK
ncbi:MAG: FKBP-type peptidyl-prolyl cis-trans isomerase [Raineya sp.]